MKTITTGGQGTLSSEVHGSVSALKAAALVFAFGVLAHNLDHLRRGLDVITPQLLAGGAVVGIGSAIAVALVVLGHRDAARAAVLVGFASAVAVGTSHLAPEWGVLSDPLSAPGMDAWTWAAILSAVGGGLVLGAAGLNAVRGERGAER